MKMTVPRVLIPLAVVAVASGGFVRAASAQEPAHEPLEYNRDVRPVLTRACLACHGPSEGTRQADLRLDTDAFIDRVIVPGDAEASPLFQRLTSADQVVKMPPVASGRSLTDEQIDLVRRWIDGGAAWGAELAEADVPAVPERVVDFAREVRPILSQNCFTCHGPDAQGRQRGLRLDVQEGPFADRGEFGGPVIVPGNAADSLLIHRVGADDLLVRMPYRLGLNTPVMPGAEEDGLSADEIETLRLWIDQGAEWQSHWAFTPPERPAVPPVADAEWPRNPIDNFVLAGLEADGLAPAGETDRATLLRRASFDLTGLPPLEGDMAAFLNDDSPDAFENAVDRLLASAGYGERMAVEWLDGARYADSSGYQTDAEADDVALPRLGHRRLQLEHAVRPVHHRAVGGRPAARRDPRAAHRHRLQPEPQPERRGRHHPRGVPGRERGRPGVDDRHGVDGPDPGVRPLPRPQVRPRVAEGVLRGLRLLQQRARAGQGVQVRQLAADDHRPHRRSVRRARLARRRDRRGARDVRRPRGRRGRGPARVGRLARRRGAGRLGDARQAPRALPPRRRLRGRLHVRAGLRLPERDGGAARRARAPAGRAPGERQARRRHAALRAGPNRRGARLRRRAVHRRRRHRQLHLRRPLHAVGVGPLQRPRRGHRVAGAGRRPGRAGLGAVPHRRQGAGQPVPALVRRRGSGRDRRRPAPERVAARAGDLYRQAGPRQLPRLRQRRAAGAGPPDGRHQQPHAGARRAATHRGERPAPRGLRRHRLAAAVPGLDRRRPHLPGGPHPRAGGGGGDGRVAARHRPHRPRRPDDGAGREAPPRLPRPVRGRGGAGGVAPPERPRGPAGGHVGELPDDHGHGRAEPAARDVPADPRGLRRARRAGRPERNRRSCRRCPRGPRPTGWRSPSGSSTPSTRSPPGSPRTGCGSCSSAPASSRRARTSACRASIPATPSCSTGSRRRSSTRAGTSSS